MSKKQIKLSHIIIILVIALVLLSVLGLAILYLVQHSTPENKVGFYRPSELIDTVKQISEPERGVTPIGIKREEIKYNKPFASGDYAYDERTPDFRLVCTNPCPVSKSILDQEFAAIAYALSTTRGLTQSDIHSDILPFEVHASDDDACKSDPTQYAAYAVEYYVDPNGYNRGLLCFFYDKINYDRSKFPYTASVHEVMHLFEFKKIERNSVIYEGLSEMLDSFFLKGNDKNSFCWQGNFWYKDAAQTTHDPHWVGGNLFFQLCNQYRFDYDDLPALFGEIDRRGYVTIREFIELINNIVGTDTSQLFKDAGVI